MVSTAPTTDFAALRDDFPLFANTKSPIHYLDSAASSQKPQCVIDAIKHCYERDYGPVHRGLYPLAEKASQQYETARQTLANFIRAANPNDIVFTRSATEAINLIAIGWASRQVQPGDQVWVSQMEHHSNLLPWQRACRECGATLRMIPLDGSGKLDLNGKNGAIANGLFGKQTRLIALTHISNVLGVINPIADIVAQANKSAIPVLVDAAQSLGHMPLSVQALNCDFLVGSAHKMCGPTGIGFLYAKTERLSETEPLLLGGGMVDELREQSNSWADIPARFEAGSPNLAGAAGLAAACDYLALIGTECIEQHISALSEMAFERLSAISDVTVYGPASSDNRAGILSFNIDGVHPHDVAQIAGEHGVAIRAGHHCCQPLMTHLGESGTARASFHFYNTPDDVNALINTVHEARRVFTGRKV